MPGLKALNTQDEISAAPANVASCDELTRILRELAQFEEAFARADARREGTLEHEAALAGEGRAVYVTRTRRG